MLVVVVYCPSPSPSAGVASGVEETSSGPVPSRSPEPDVHSRRRGVRSAASEATTRVRRASSIGMWRVGWTTRAGRVRSCERRAPLRAQRGRRSYSAERSEKVVGAVMGGPRPDKRHIENRGLRPVFQQNLLQIDAILDALTVADKRRPATGPASGTWRSHGVDQRRRPDVRRPYLDSPACGTDGMEREWD